MSGVREMEVELVCADNYTLIKHFNIPSSCSCMKCDSSETKLEKLTATMWCDGTENFLFLRGCSGEKQRKLNSHQMTRMLRQYKKSFAKLNVDVSHFDSELFLKASGDEGNMFSERKLIIFEIHTSKRNLWKKSSKKIEYSTLSRSGWCSTYKKREFQAINFNSACVAFTFRL